MSDVVETVKNDLVSAIEKDQLILPTLPEVALQVREVAEDPNSSVNQLAKVIGNDAALTARVIKVCNSPLMRGSREVHDLGMAINRLGINYSANLATGLAMEQMFQATSDVIDSKMREVWSRSTEIAGICHVLAKHYTRLQPDQATLAGLTHQIGILPILSYAEEHSNLLSSSITLEAVIDELHPIIGEMILKSWDFPAGLLTVPKQYLEFDRQADQADFTDLVTVATLQSYAGSDHPLGQVNWHDVTAFARVGLDPEMDEQEGEDLSEQMAAAASLLNQ